MYATNGLGLAKWTADDYRRWAAAQAAARVAAKRRVASSKSAASGMAAARRAEAAAKAAAAQEAVSRATAAKYIAAATTAGASDIDYQTWLRQTNATAAMKRAFKKARNAKNAAIKLRAGSVASAASSAAAAAKAYRDWKALQWAKKYIPLDGLGLAPSPLSLNRVRLQKMQKQSGRSLQRSQKGHLAVMPHTSQPWLSTSGLGEMALTLFDVPPRQTAEGAWKMTGSRRMKEASDVMRLAMKVALARYPKNHIHSSPTELHPDTAAFRQYILSVWNGLDRDLQSRSTATKQRVLRDYRTYVKGSQATSGLGDATTMVGGVLAVGAVAAAAYFLFGKQLGLKKNPRRRRRSRRRSRRR